MKGHFWLFWGSTITNVLQVGSLNAPRFSAADLSSLFLLSFSLFWLPSWPYKALDILITKYIILFKN